MSAGEQFSVKVAPISAPPEPRTLENATEAFAAATRRIKGLGEQLDREFSALSKAQAALAGEGVEVNATFDAPTQAAYGKWLADNNLFVPLATPRVIR